MAPDVAEMRPPRKGPTLRHTSPDRRSVGTGPEGTTVIPSSSAMVAREATEGDSRLMITQGGGMLQRYAAGRTEASNRCLVGLRAPRGGGVRALRPPPSRAPAPWPFPARA